MKESKRSYLVFFLCIFQQLRRDKLLITLQRIHLFSRSSFFPFVISSFIFFLSSSYPFIVNFMLFYHLLLPLSSFSRFSSSFLRLNLYHQLYTFFSIYSFFLLSYFLVCFPFLLPTFFRQRYTLFFLLFPCCYSSFLRLNLYHQRYPPLFYYFLLPFPLFCHSSPSFLRLNLYHQLYAFSLLFPSFSSVISSFIFFLSSS